MTGDDLLAEAVVELYSADPEEFMPRRLELAGQARSAGQAVAAKQITALRKPTRTAWMINQLARSDPDATARLTELGDELRAVERSGDGRRLRELSQTRRQLIAALVKRVLEVTGQHVMSAALREEITATFAAALADPEVAEQIQRGALVRAERRSGFGTAHAPTLTVVPPLPDSHRAAKVKPKPKKPKTDAPTSSSATTADPPHTTTAPPPASPAAAPLGRAATGPDLAPATRAETAAARAERAAERAEQAAAEAKAAQERRQAKVRAKAEEALVKADRAVADAAQEQQEQEKTIRRLERDLAKARGGLRQAAADARKAEAAQRKARHALTRLPD
ncbi:MAG TPA: hypothetical protein VHY58_14975 [Streptosporangiaceae bacterium]|nr:hypothetical protein [Streptosporangiaceae bacterium]